MNRREFLLSTAGTGLYLAGSSVLSTAAAQEPEQKNPGDVYIALIGAGAQGRVLIDSALAIPGVRFKAICDIWEYSQRYASRFLKRYGHDVNVYEDYREMLDAEKDLDAVIVASPDWMHAEHANACLNAGLDVYCEKEMSNSLEAARTMVETQRKTGRLLQVGHQRRSNPRYLHAIDNLIHEVNLLGRVTHANAQWNRSKSDDLGWPRQYEIPPETLAKYGYANMQEFRNWRWYRKYGGGPIVDLGSHQIDIFSWIFGTNPKSVMASGGIDYYKDHEWFDNVMAIYEYETDEGIARAFYQVLTTTKHGGFYETFMGDNGSIQISEVAERGNSAVREAHAPGWDEWAKRGYLTRMTQPLQRSDSKNIAVDVRVTQDTGKWPLPVELAKPAHQPHLENFFNAIRKGTPLTCPAEVGYETAVTVLRVNEAVEAGRQLDFKPEEFRV